MSEGVNKGHIFLGMMHKSTSFVHLDGPSLLPESLATFNRHKSSRIFMWLGVAYAWYSLIEASRAKVGPHTFKHDFSRFVDRRWWVRKKRRVGLAKWYCKSNDCSRASGIQYMMQM